MPEHRRKFSPQFKAEAVQNGDLDRQAHRAGGPVTWASTRVRGEPGVCHERGEVAWVAGD